MCDVNFGSKLARYQTNTSAEVLDTITNIQPKESGGGSGETRESIVYNMAEDMLKKLPPNYVPHEVSLSIQIISSKTNPNKNTHFEHLNSLSLWDSGESQTSEDGGSEPNEHLPSSGSGSNAEDHQCGASESD